MQVNNKNVRTTSDECCDEDLRGSLYGMRYPTLVGYLTRVIYQ